MRNDCLAYRVRAFSARAKAIHALAALCAVCRIACDLHAQSYLITDLGTNVLPVAINNHGDVVGLVGGTTIDPHTSRQRAFFYTNGVATNIPFTAGTTNNGANAINNLGQSVGWFQDGAGGVRAFLSTDSASLNDLGVGVTGYPSASTRWDGASVINDAGQILGMRNSTTPRVYLIANGQTNDLPIITGGAGLDWTLVGGMNQNGDVVYMAATNGFNASYHACLYTNGVQFVLPTPVNKASYGYAINDSNHVVGAFSTTNSPFVQQLFYYNGSTFTNIGGPGTNLAGPPSAYSINNYDQVVGMAYDTNRSPPALIAALYDPINGLRDINPMLPPGSGWSIGPPAAINDPGQITGQGLFNGVVHGYLLTPALICDPASFKYNSHTGNVTFSVSGLNGQQVIIQVSCDLMSWVSIATNTVSQNKVTFSDSGTCSTGTRVYRAVVIQ
jgi:probable HAF family extracellular repeat protein